MIFLQHPERAPVSIDINWLAPFFLFVIMFLVINVTFGLFALSIGLAIWAYQLWGLSREYKRVEAEYQDELAQYISICSNSYDITTCKDRAQQYDGTSYIHRFNTVYIFSNREDEILFELDTGIAKGAWFTNIRSNIYTIIGRKYVL